MSAAERNVATDSALKDEPGNIDVAISLVSAQRLGDGARFRLV